MNCLIKFFTDRCQTKKDFRLFSRLKVMKKAELRNENYKATN